MGLLPKWIKPSIRVGQSLVEVLTAVGLTAIFLPALLTGLVASREGKAQQLQRSEATALMREATEAVRVVREQGWVAFAVNGTYHPAVSSGTWSLVSGAQTVNNYTRSIVIGNVYRNSSGDIVSSGGTLDPSTKKIDITVSWSNPTASSVSTTLYVTRYLDNLSFSQSTQADFNTGTLSNLQVTAGSDGEISLAPNTKGQWCEPTISGVTIDLPGLPNAVTAIEGHVFAATGQTAVSTQDSFAHVLVGNSSPPTFTLNGKHRGYKTNAVFGDANYGYIATTNNSKEIVIIDLNQYSDVPNKIYAEAGYFNTPSSTADADTVFVSGSRGYMTSGQYLYVFDLSSKSGSRSQIGNRISFANSGDKAGEIYVRTLGADTYAFIAIEGSTPEELKIANVTNHNNSSTWRIISSINIEPNNCSSLESGKAIYVKPDGTRAYISSVNDTSFKEFFIVDTGNKSSLSLVGGFATNPPCTNGGGYEAGGMNPEQSQVVGVAENRAVLVGTDATGDSTNSLEYQVLDLSNESSPSMCGSLQYDPGIYGVAAVKETDGDTFAYLITGDTTNELKVIQGGPDGNFSDSGTYESATFDSGYNSAYNRLSAVATLPANTNIQFQVAVADAVSGSCSGASFDFVGPDGTSGTFYPATGGKLALDDDGSGYENPGRCIRYRAFLSSSDLNSSPSLESVIINYSP